MAKNRPTNNELPAQKLSAAGLKRHNEKVAQTATRKPLPTGKRAPKDVAVLRALRARCIDPATGAAARDKLLPYLLPSVHGVLRQYGGTQASDWGHDDRHGRTDRDQFKQALIAEALAVVARWNPDSGANLTTYLRKVLREFAKRYLAETDARAIGGMTHDASRNPVAAWDRLENEADEDDIADASATAVAAAMGGGDDEHVGPVKPWDAVDSLGAGNMHGVLTCNVLQEALEGASRLAETWVAAGGHSGKGSGMRALPESGNIAELAQQRTREKLLALLEHEDANGARIFKQVAKRADKYTDPLKQYCNESRHLRDSPEKQAKVRQALDAACLLWLELTRKHGARLHEEAHTEILAAALAADALRTDEQRRREDSSSFYNSIRYGGGEHVSVALAQEARRVVPLAPAPAPIALTLAAKFSFASEQEADAFVRQHIGTQAFRDVRAVEDFALIGLIESFWSWGRLQRELAQVDQLPKRERTVARFAVNNMAHVCGVRRFRAEHVAAYRAFDLFSAGYGQDHDADGSDDMEYDDDFRGVPAVG